MEWSVINEAIGNIFLGNKSFQIRSTTSTDSKAKNFY